MAKEQFISIPNTNSEQIAKNLAWQLRFPRGTRFHKVSHTPPWQQEAVRIFHPDTFKNTRVSGKLVAPDIEVRRMYLDKGLGLIKENGHFDLSRWQSTDSYILETSDRVQGFCMVELKDMIQQQNEIRDKSLVNHLKKLIINVRWALAESHVNFP